MWESERDGVRRVLVAGLFWFGAVMLGVLICTALCMAGLRDLLLDKPAHVKDVARQLVGGIVQHGFGLAACLAIIRFIHCRPVARLFTDGRSFQFGLALESAAVWAVLWFAGVLLVPGGWNSLVQRAGEVPLQWWPVLSIVVFLAITLQATDEEVFFRGYLLPRVGAWVKSTWLAIGFVTVLFTVLHRQASVPAVVSIALFGIVFAIGSILAGTLAPVIAMHATHNALGKVWFPTATNAGAAWSEAAVVALQLLVWITWLKMALHRRSDRTTESYLKRNSEMTSIDR